MQTHEKVLLAIVFAAALVSLAARTIRFALVREHDETLDPY